MTSSSSAPASGSWAVKELTGGGLKIVLFEAGRNLDIAHDFPADAELGGGGIVGRIQIGDSGPAGSGAMPIR